MRRMTSRFSLSTYRVDVSLSSRKRAKDSLSKRRIVKKFVTSIKRMNRWATIANFLGPVLGDLFRVGFAFDIICVSIFQMLDRMRDKREMLKFWIVIVQIDPLIHFYSIACAFFVIINNDKRRRKASINRCISRVRFFSGALLQ